MRRRKKRAIFGFYFFLSLILMLTLNIVDVFMLRQNAIDREAEKLDVPGSDVKVHPYHFWVNSIFYMTAQLTVAVAYYFITKDTLGMFVLISVAAIFSLFAVQDIMYFFYQGQEYPEDWTWLYWQNSAFGSPLNLRFVLGMATMGTVLIVALFFLRYRKLR